VHLGCRGLEEMRAPNPPEGPKCAAVGYRSICTVNQRMAFAPAAVAFVRNFAIAIAHA
jgi:hypothetical protein